MFASVPLDVPILQKSAISHSNPSHLLDPRSSLTSPPIPLLNFLSSVITIVYYLNPCYSECGPHWPDLGSLPGIQNPSPAQT